jgi:hypothetical protein
MANDTLKEASSLNMFNIRLLLFLIQEEITRKLVIKEKSLMAFCGFTLSTTEFKSWRESKAPLI